MLGEAWLTPTHIAILTGTSAVMLVGSALSTPWLLARLPADYFSQLKPHLWERLKSGSAKSKLGLLAKNLVGLVLLATGFMMLFLPGQGLLTMLTGLVLMDFPGKFALERWLISRKSLFQAVNWLRQRGGAPPLKRPSPGDHA